MPHTTLGMPALLSAARIVSDIIPATRFIRSASLSELTGGDIWLKLECQQPTGSFKVRGAIHKIYRLLESGIEAGLVTGSAGNHGLGVAFAGEQLGVQPVTIFVPTTAPAPKLKKLSRFPVNVIQIGVTYEDAHQAAESFAHEQGVTYVPAYDDIDIIAGQGTAGLEMVLQEPDLDLVIVPVGGGGLIAGIASAVKELSPLCMVVGVQAAASPSALLSFERGEPIDPYEHEPTIADGLAGGFGALPFLIARTLIDEIKLASEAELKSAIFYLLEQEQLIVEASGAAAIVPLLQNPNGYAGMNVGCVLSGANLDLDLLREIVQEHFSSDE
jgi:threonine dehydratase